LVAKSLENWAGCIVGALDVAEYRRGLIGAGFVDVEVIPENTTPLAGIAQNVPGFPYSALITAKKP
jgi:hypothetical protein